MSLSSFLSETVVTKTGIVTLNEGIVHIEALPVRDFINAIENVATFTASEKLDGSNLTFGFENNGKFYTSREAKGGKRFYNEDDFSDRPADTGFKSAHNVLQKVVGEMKGVLDNGEAVEVEVLYGRQPNAIVYGSNYIAFLRMVPGDNNDKPDQDKIQALGDLMKNRSIDVTTHGIATDGITNKAEASKQTWKFTTTSFIDNHHFQKVDVKAELKNFRHWLVQKHASGYTNEELMTVNLSSVKKEHRSAIKQAREDAIDGATNKFKLPIKEKFLDQVLRVMKPALRDVEVTTSEDVGVEGVVLLNPKTQQQLKIVDKDVFTIINQFNHAIRNEIKKTSYSTQSFAASLGNDQDIFGKMLTNIAAVHGIEQLGVYNSIKRTLRKMSGKTMQGTLKNVVGAFKTQKLSTLKSGIANAVEQGLKDLDAGLKKYESEWKNYRLKLKTGKEVTYTDEIHKRTLVTFAEVRKEMQEMQRDIAKSTEPEQIVVALYGKQLFPLH